MNASCYEPSRGSVIVFHSGWGCPTSYQIEYPRARGGTVAVSADIALNIPSLYKTALSAYVPASQPQSERAHRTRVRLVHPTAANHQPQVMVCLRSIQYAPARGGELAWSLTVTSASPSAPIKLASPPIGLRLHIMALSRRIPVLGLLRAVHGVSSGARRARSSRPRSALHGGRANVLRACDRSV
jgi:hypothetical protein